MPIDIPGLDVARAKRYSRIKLALGLTHSAVSTAAAAWLVGSGRAKRLERVIAGCVPDRRLTTPAYLGALMVASSAASLPFGFVQDLLVERRFGLTKQSTCGWLGDQAKGTAVGAALGVPLMTGAHAVIRKRPDDWWLVLAGATVPLSVVFGRLAPVLLMPLFNRFDRLDDAALVARIQALGERAGVTIADVFRMDMSRQTEKPNAFFTGLGGTSRIVLADTLLDRFQVDEIEAIVAHELGHQVHRDIWRFIALGSGLGVGVFWFAGRAGPAVVRRWRERTGIGAIDEAAALPLIGLLMSIAGSAASPVMAAVSRRIEARTDRYAVELTGNGPALGAALARLATASLSDPSPPRWQVLLFHSHPPLEERIRRAGL